MAIVWESLIDGTEFPTEDDARDYVREHVDFDDIVEQIGNNITYYDLVRELSKFDSPLFYQLLEEAENEVFDNIISTYETDED
jgi:hypothetical protein